jgi:hypothetical protein
VDESRPRNMRGVFGETGIIQARNKKRAAAEATALGIISSLTSD